MDAPPGMQTVTFRCKLGDTFVAHGHIAHGPHGHEVRRLRDALKRGCTAMKLRPGSTKLVRCGAAITETITHHPTAHYEPAARRLAIAEDAPAESPDAGP
jgi:hypothetical protein